MARMSRHLIEYGLEWRWTEQRLEACIRKPEHQIIGAFRAGEPAAAGFAAMAFGRQQAHLLLLAVRPDARRQGLGRALIGWLETSMRAMGLDLVVVESRANNHRGLRFYEALGFKVSRRLPGYYQGMEDALRLTWRLPTRLPEPTLPKETVSRWEALAAPWLTSAWRTKEQEE